MTNTQHPLLDLFPGAGQSWPGRTTSPTRAQTCWAGLGRQPYLAPLWVAAFWVPCPHREAVTGDLGLWGLRALFCSGEGGLEHR